MFDMIRNQMQASVPFAAHSGVVLTELGDTGATAQMPQSAFSENHIASQHAGALFTLGETASGAAMAGVFAPVMMAIRPVTSDATIRYLKVAKGLITARAAVAGEAAGLLSALALQGRVSFPVDVRLTDEAGDDVATMQVQWHVSTNQRRTAAA